MSISRFIMPRQGVNGQNLNPGDGAKLTFHNAGLLTDKDTYSDEAATTPNTNPVIADATGLFGSIWINGVYDVTLKDKNGVKLWGPERLTSVIPGENTVNINQGIMDYDPLVTYLEGAISKSPTTPERYRSIIEQTDNDIDADDGTNWGLSGSAVIATEYGPLLADLKVALAASLVRKTWCDCAGATYEVDVDFIMPAGSRMRNFRLLYTANVAFRGDVGCEMVDGFIDGNGVADYGIRDVVSGTSGMLRGRIQRIFITGCLITDLRLNGYHWMCQIDRVWCFSQGNSSWGMHIDNYLGFTQPDITITNCYVDNGNNSGSGMKLDNGHYHVSGSSADNVVTAFGATNSFITLENCGFEQFSKSSYISSAQVKLNQCVVTASTGPFTGDSGQYAFFHISGGTIDGSLELNGGIYQNNSDNDCALIRGLSSDVAEHITISNDLEYRPVVSALTDFIYQSTGTPSLAVARKCHLGNNRMLTTWGSKDPTGTSFFPIENSPNSEDMPIHSDCTARYIQWKETGANTAGGTTTVAFVVYHEAGSEERRQAGVISIPGVSSSTAAADKRRGSTILDMPLSAGEYVKFLVTTPGQRIGTGFAITLVIDE